MKFGIENNTIASYKRFSYEAWFAFAEFVDNSTQAYFDNRKTLDPLFERTGEAIKVEITYNYGDDIIIIKDNSIGMSEDELDRALKVGLPPTTPTGRSRYGLGLKTAACWFGDLWTIETKKYGLSTGVKIVVDVPTIANHIGPVEITPTIYNANPEEHGTTITIQKLNRKLQGRTITKVREYLSSIYRSDFEKYNLELIWNGIELKWEGFESKIHTDKDGTKTKINIDLVINGKAVKGWAAVLGKGGSRKFGGFALIQNGRVIENNYSPSSIFGETEDNLINQRIVGELLMQDFAVSHTKDKIVWEKNEEAELDEALGIVCENLKAIAQSLRFRKESATVAIERFKVEVVGILAGELKSDEITDYLQTDDILPEGIIASSDNKILARIVDEDEPAMKVEVGIDENKVLVSVYFSQKSEYEPYVVSETTVDSNKVIIVINDLHPHILEMTSTEVLLNFVRHCVYDGISEWRAWKLRKELQPHTIKSIKDRLLRMAYEIKSNTYTA